MSSDYARFQHLYLGSDYGGFTVDFYEAGTLTDKYVWIDRYKSTGVYQIRADSNGMVTWFADGIYRLRVLEADGTLLYDWDNVRQIEDFKIDSAILASNYASLNAAIADIGSTETDLLITTQLPMTADATVSSTMRLVSSRGGSIDQSTYALTINSDFDAGSYQVFDGTGAVTFGAGSVTEVYPEWWGATGDGITDDSTAIQNAINSFPIAGTQAELGGGGKILFSKGIYLCNTGIANSGRKISFIGSSIDDTTIRKGANDIDLLKVDSFCRSQIISNMTLDGNSKTGLSLLYLNTPNYMILENLSIVNSSSTVSALYLYQATVTTLRNVWVTDNVKSAYFYQINACHMYNFIVSGSLITALYNDVEFDGATDTSIFGILLGGYTGLLAHSCFNFNIHGLYSECPLTVPLITIGSSGKPCKNVSINNVNVTGSGSQPGPCIRVQFSSFAVSIRDVNIVGTGGIYAGGWIELAECFNISIDNITAQDLDSTTGLSGANLIFSSSVGPDNVSINNVHVRDDPDNTATIVLKVDNLVVTNCNVPITILDQNCTKITLINCTGTITDLDNKSVRINEGYTSSFKIVASATELTIGGGDVFSITGTTSITSIAAADTIRGRRITLIFDDILTFTDGNNLTLAGNFTTSGGDTINLVCNGTTWSEMSRSAN